MLVHPCSLNTSEHEGKGRSRYNSSGKSQHIPLFNRQYIQRKKPNTLVIKNAMDEMDFKTSIEH
jgi:hypothetical protein